MDSDFGIVTGVIDFVFVDSAFMDFAFVDINLVFVDTTLRL